MFGYYAFGSRHKAQRPAKAREVSAVFSSIKFFSSTLCLAEIVKKYWPFVSNIFVQRASAARLYGPWSIASPYNMWPAYQTLPSAIVQLALYNGAVNLKE